MSIDNLGSREVETTLVDLDGVTGYEHQGTEEEGEVGSLENRVGSVATLTFEEISQQQAEGIIGNETEIVEVEGRLIPLNAQTSLRDFSKISLYFNTRLSNTDAREELEELLRICSQASRLCMDKNPRLSEQRQSKNSLVIKFKKLEDYILRKLANLEEDPNEKRILLEKSIVSLEEATRLLEEA